MVRASPHPTPVVVSCMLRTGAPDCWTSSIRRPRKFSPARGWPQGRIMCALSPKLTRYGLQSLGRSVSRYSRYLTMEHPCWLTVNSFQYLAGQNLWSSDIDRRSPIYGAVLLSPLILGTTELPTDGPTGARVLVA